MSESFHNTTPPFFPRKLLVDLDQPIARDWCGGDAFRTALFNSFSFAFPVGEQNFIDAVKMALPLLPEPARSSWEPIAQAFIAQEAIHRRVHSLFNERLEAQGLHNSMPARMLERKRRRKSKGVDPLTFLALTVGVEHSTAVISNWFYEHPQALAGTPEPILDMWLWHTAEELEHRSVAFDLYTALGGKRSTLISVFLLVSFFFFSDVIRQTLSNLHRHGSLFKLSTWSSAARFLFGPRHGLWRAFLPWLSFLRPGHHPSQGTPAADQAAAWLLSHPEKTAPVRGPVS